MGKIKTFYGKEYEEFCELTARTYKCTMCGKEFITEEDTMYGHIEMCFSCGYGSVNDGNVFKVKLCNSCLDKAIHYMLKNCKGDNPYEMSYIDEDYKLDLDAYREKCRKGYFNDDGSLTDEAEDILFAEIEEIESKYE